MVHRSCDVNKMLPELTRHVSVHPIAAYQFVPRQLEGNAQHVEAVHSHPTGAVGLLNVSAAGKYSAAVKNTDVVEPEETSLKDVLPFRVFAIYPPIKVQQELVKNTLQKPDVPISAILLFVDFVYSERRPGMHRWVDISEGPFIGGELTVGMHIPLAQHEQELLFSEVRIHVGQRDAME